MEQTQDDCVKTLEEWHEVYRRKTVYDRAVPNLMDGLKPVQRKVLYTALRNLASGKSMNTGAFSGTLKAQANYHHGDASRDGAIVNLTSTHCNQLPMFIGEGNFGSRIERMPAATRYTQVKFNPDYAKLLVMQEILKHTPQDDNETYEPDFYYFSIPMVLVNGISGIAVGMKTDILGYKICDILDNVKRVLAGKRPERMTPFFPEFTGNVVDRGNGMWSQIGTVKQIGPTTLQITEIPTCYDRSKYVSVLQMLKERRIISGYDDESTENFDIRVTATRKQIEAMSERGFENSLKLVFSLKEDIKVLSPDGKSVVEYASPEDLLVDYVKMFLVRVAEFIVEKKREFTEAAELATDKIKFVEYMSSGIDFAKKKTSELAAEAAEHAEISLERAKQFMGMSISGMTSEAAVAARTHLSSVLAKLKYYSESATPKKVYESMLK
jgi:DNA topoisomerase-2